MKKKLISQLVCVTMALSLTSVSVLAEETNAAAEVNEGAAEGKEEGKEEPQEEEQAAPQLNTMEQRSNAWAPGGGYPAAAGPGRLRYLPDGPPRDGLSII